MNSKRKTLILAAMSLMASGVVTQNADALCSPGDPYCMDVSGSVDGQIGSPSSWSMGNLATPIAAGDYGNQMGGNDRSPEELRALECANQGGSIGNQGTCEFRDSEGRECMVSNGRGGLEPGPCAYDSHSQTITETRTSWVQRVALTLVGWRNANMGRGCGIVDTLAGIDCSSDLVLDPPILGMVSGSVSAASRGLRMMDTTDNMAERAVYLWRTNGRDTYRALDNATPGLDPSNVADYGVLQQVQHRFVEIINRIDHGR
jgi:hypothetical protein